MAIAQDDKYILKVEQDDSSESPRKWDNLGTMVCWHRRYNLGDEHNYSSPSDFLQEFACELFGYEDVDWIQDKAKEYMSNFKVTKGDDSFEIYEKGELYDDGYENEDDCYNELANVRGQFIDEIYENMSNNELLEIIEQKAVILPLYLYDHSGITMNTCGFTCKWDSGQVGWIYCTKERFLKETGYNKDELFNTDTHRIPKVKDHVKINGHEDLGQITSIENDKITIDFDYNKSTAFKKDENIVTVSTSDVIEVLSNYAEQMLTAEVETYDQYLTGEVYGYQLEKPVKCECCGNVEYEEIDSCWGFYGDDCKKNGIADQMPKEYQYLLDELQYA